MVWVLGGYMWLFIHRPFEVWPWIGEYRIELVYSLGMLAYWGCCVPKTWNANRMNAAVAGLVLAIVVSGLMSVYHVWSSQVLWEFWKAVLVYAIVVTMAWDERDFKRLVLLFVLATGLYMAHSFREYLCGRRFYSMGVTRMDGLRQKYGHPNSFAATCVVALPLIFPVWYEYSKRWQRTCLVGYLGLTVVCILLTSSRAAFATLVALVLLPVLTSQRRLKYLGVLAVASPLIWLSLSESRQNRILTIVDSSYGPANARVSAEGRQQGWIDGVKMWKQRPVLGVGPCAFAAERGYTLNAHHLYGQILGEIGTVGAIAFAALVGAFWANALAVRGYCRQHPELASSFEAHTVLALAVSIGLLLIEGFGGHLLYRYNWLWFAGFQLVSMCRIEAEIHQKAESYGLALSPPHVASGLSTVSSC